MSASQPQPQGFHSLDNEALIAQWRTEKDNTLRDLILREMEERDLYPSEDVRRDEADGALYPDIRDPDFLNLLLRKREFIELQAEPFKMLEEGDDDPCSTDLPFKITTVQQFVRNFLSPKTPYNSALLYHSVGVGKTQAGIQVAESFLELYPRRKIFIVAPRTIQSGFYRNIFDINRIAIGTGDEANTANQGTGDLYMRLTGTLFERNKDVIERKVNEAIRRRYAFFGYLAFRNYIQKVINARVGKLAENKAALIQKALEQEFSGRVVIIDEAHHLREAEAATEEGEEADTTGAGGRADSDESKAGANLVPYLKQVLAAADGLKLVLMTATPMYNTAKEIITLLNFMLLNDKRATLTESQIFDRSGSLRSSAHGLLATAASAYVSFMRGENPRTFPVRLFPRGAGEFEYPSVDPGGLVEVPEESRIAMNTLPLVPSYLSEEGVRTLEELQNEEISEGAAQSGRYGISTRDRLIQAGNFIFPVEPDEENFGEGGFQNTFVKEGKGAVSKYTVVDGVSPDWLALENIGEFSPKTATVLKSVQYSKGVCFIYSRFVTTGALMIAMALEANGYTISGRPTGIFKDGIQSPGGRQCALCPLKEKGHSGDHSFTPAKYVILTGNDELSPKNAESIAAARAAENKNGGQIKIVIGSQVAAEGVDLRFIREIHIFDSWYHLNKTDQVIGRGIRFCSHSLLPISQRNATIFLHVVIADGTRETMDLYSYRMALAKARQVGEVSRLLKIHAVDCNLNHDAIVIAGQPPIRMEDSQGYMRDNVNINDTPFSPLCDWLETCEYKCVPTINLSAAEVDDSTYDEFTSRYKDTALKMRVRNLFATQVSYDVELFRQNFADVPAAAYGMLLNEILGNKGFRVKHKGIDGYVIYKNKYFLFQPTIIDDARIPLALRTTFFAVRRDHFIPEAIEPRKLEEAPELAATTAAAATVATAEVANKWAILSAWASSIIDSPTDTLTEDVTSVLSQMAGGVDKKTRRFEQEFKAILKLPRFFKGEKDALKRALKEFIFDECLTQKEQESVLRAGTDGGAGAEQKVKVGSIDMFRFLDLKSGEIVYKRSDGQAIPPSLLEIVQSSTTDEVLQRRPWATIVGPYYGFITTKKGEYFVFKRGVPVKEGAKKVDRGAECANVSETADKIKKLGEMIELYGTDKIDATTWGAIKNMNAFQLCIVTDMFFRLMDLRRHRTKRWFFRPIAAAAAGHRGKA